MNIDISISWFMTRINVGFFGDIEWGRFTTGHLVWIISGSGGVFVLIG